MAGMELLKVDWPRFVNLSGNYFLALLRGQKVSEGKRFKDLFKEEKKKKRSCGLLCLRSFSNFSAVSSHLDADWLLTCLSYCSCRLFRGSFCGFDKRLKIILININLQWAPIF